MTPKYRDQWSSFSTEYPIMFKSMNKQTKERISSLSVPLYQKGVNFSIPCHIDEINNTINYASTGSIDHNPN